MFYLAGTMISAEFKRQKTLNLSNFIVRKMPQ